MYGVVVGDFMTLVEKMMGGGPEAIIAGLIAFICLLLLDRKRLHDQLQKKEEKIDKIIDDYHSGNLTLAEALNSLKHVLFEIKGRL